MAGVNRVIVYGYLAADPAYRTLADGNAEAAFVIGVNENGADGVEWFKIRVTASGAAKIARDYLHKGDPVFIEGRLKQINWTDKKNVKRFAFEVAVEPFKGRLSLMKSGGSAAKQNVPESDVVVRGNGDGGANPFLGDDIPF